MGWLTSARDDAPRTQWGMNDAGYERESGTSNAKFWFQAVDTTPAVAPLSWIQPFVRCAYDVITRLGDFEMRCVEVLVPGPTEAVAGRGVVPSALAESAAWFAVLDTTLGADVEMVVASRELPGSDADATLATQLFDVIPPVVFECARHHVEMRPKGPRSFAEDIIDEVLPTRTRLEGRLCEWSAAAAAWSVELIGHAYRASPVGGPIVVTIIDRSARQS